MTFLSLQSLEPPVARPRVNGSLLASWARFFVPAPLKPLPDDNRSASRFNFLLLCNHNPRSLFGSGLCVGLAN